LSAAARHVAAVAPSSVTIGVKADEHDLVQVRYLEGGGVRQLELGDFLDANIRDMTDEEVDALYAGDKVVVESPIMGPYEVQVLR